jgi:colicin import membrane protein
MMRAARILSTLVLMMGIGSACSKEAPPPPPPPPAPAPPPPPAAPAPEKPKMVANPDGLSLADRIAKRQAAEKKLAAELAVEEHDRLLAYDKTKLPLHKAVFADIQKYRGAYAHAKTKEDVENVRVKQQKALEATGKKMSTIDPKGGNSNVVTDYDVMLNALANDYPDALELSFAGDKKGLEEQTAELDKRTKKIEDWLAEVKTAKPPKSGKKK